MMKNRVHPMESHGNATAILTGAIAVGLLSAGAIFLLAPRATKKLRDDLYEAYQDISEKAEDLKEDLLSDGQEYLSSTAKKWNKTLQKRNDVKLALGGLAGAIVGVTVAVLIMKNRSNIAEDVKQRSHLIPKDLRKKGVCWLKSATQILNTLDDALSEKDEEEPVHTGPRDRIDDFIDLATLGFQLYQKYKSR